MKFFLLFCLLTVTFHPQSLRIPQNFKKAYQSGTRTDEGKPGPKYWQNTTDYTINTRMVIEERKILGKLSAVYYNNSPDTLKEIVLRLYQDLFRKGVDRDFEINPSDVTEGTQIISLSVAEKNIDITDGKRYNRARTNAIVTPEQPLLPQSRTTIEIEWEVTLPRFSTIRMGAYDSVSFYVAYWYPQIAVYDDIDGWDKLSYSGQTEFYNDFNNYTVFVTVPKNFIVWATGELQNPSECFSAEVYKRYMQARASESIVKIIDSNSVSQPKTVDKSEITYLYRASSVPDFVFALSNNYFWDGVRTTVDLNTGRTVFISAAYKKSSLDFYEVADIAKKSIQYFSFRLPGVPYPYPSMTVFNGGGGMEAPMMVNDGSSPNRAQAVGLTSHEIAHTYFPFMMGINERKYAWMDEGWAVMLPYDFQQEEGKYDPRLRNSRSYSSIGGTESDMPPILVSSFLGVGTPYRHASYVRPGFAYYFLRELLGKDVFTTALQYYIKTWQGKHPTPYDFFASFSAAAGEDLSWYFNPWFYEFKYPDLAVTSVNRENENAVVTVKNVGGLPLSVTLTFTFEDGSTKSLKASPGVWKNASVATFSFQLEGKLLKVVSVGEDYIPDTNNKNNSLVIK